MALDLADAFGSSESAETEGIWASLGDDAEVRVARLGNPEAQRAYRRMPKAIRRQLEEGLMSEKHAVDFLVRFIAQHLLKDWKGIEEGGKPLAFSQANAERKLRQHRRFRDKVWELSTDEDLFNIGEWEEDAKNSPKPSSGT
jgi:hypothetical protein